VLDGAGGRGHTAPMADAAGPGGDGPRGRGAAAVAAAAALAACHLGDRRGDLAVVFADATEPSGPRACEPLAVTFAAVELSALALARVAAAEGRSPGDVVAGIADGYARLVGRDSPSALACYAAAMAAGGEPALVRSLVERSAELHGELAAAVGATFVLAAAWRFQGRDEGCPPEAIAQRVAVAGALA